LKAVAREDLGKNERAESGRRTLEPVLFLLSFLSASVVDLRSDDLTEWIQRYGGTGAGL